MPYYKTSNSNTALPAPDKTAYACLLIGDELLSARVEDSNLKRIVKIMLPLGYKLQEVRIISDKVEDIAKHLTELRKAHALVITSGGLGPTHDDRTMQGYMRSFGSKGILHQNMHNYFIKRAKAKNIKEHSDANVHMSTMPKEAEIITLDDSWPIIKVDNCFALPGLPLVCADVLKKLALILPKYKPSFYAECYVTLWEHHYATFLTAMAEDYKTVYFGSYPIDKSAVVKDEEEKSSATSKITCTSDNKRDIEECFSKICKYMNEKNAVTKIVFIT